MKGQGWGKTYVRKSVCVWGGYFVLTLLHGIKPILLVKLHTKFITITWAFFTITTHTWYAHYFTPSWSKLHTLYVGRHFAQSRSPPIRTNVCVCACPTFPTKLE